MYSRRESKGQAETNTQLNLIVNEQQRKIQHLENILAQKHSQMAMMQSGYEQLQSEYQAKSSMSERLYNEEAEQVMQVEKKESWEDLNIVKNSVV